uniref:Uncharacterized protein n=1 Tax=Acrobeloides nanus TaxID=290746 RepID=A0A914C8F1_9BILA
MNLSWAKSFAKTALLEAQKRVDQVLEIAEGEEDEEEEKIDDEQEPEVNEELEDVTASTSGTLTGSKHSDLETSQFKEVDLSVVTNEPSDWTNDWDLKEPQTVVDTEPNPIRDTHDQAGTSLLHYSPSSSSPNGEENNGGGTSPAEVLDLSVINIDAMEQDHNRSRRSSRSHKNSGHEHHEDTATIASSDIEVIRHMDTWSVASSNHRRAASEMSVAASLTPAIKSAIENELLSNVDPSVSDRLAYLESQVHHKDKRIEELNRLIENLKTTNGNLTAKNRQMASKATSEAKIQKQLAEKDKELQELMEEGKRLSDHSGKQSREIRRLKNELSNLEIVTAARDATMEELKQAYEQVKTLTKECDELKEKLSSSEETSKRIKEDYDLSQSSTDLVQKHISEQQAQLDTFQKEVHRLSEELRHSNNAKEEFSRQIEVLNMKLRNKKAQDCFEEERERGFIEDLACERGKNAALTNQIRDLEMKIETMMSTQNDVAQQIAFANAPLLENISSLENELDLEHKIKEFQNSMNLKQSQIEELNREKRSLSEDNAVLNEKYQKKFDECNKCMDDFRKLEHEYSSLSDKYKANLSEARETSRTLEQQNKRLNEEIANLNAETARLSILLKEKEMKEPELERPASMASINTTSTPVMTPLPTYSESVRISVDDISSNPSYAVSALHVRKLITTG